MTTTEHATELAVEAITTGDNVRAGDVADGEDFAELVASVRERGLLVPLLVTAAADEDEPFLLVDGHRRLAAARKAGLEQVPVRIVGAENPADVAVLALVANVRRLALDPVEEADAYVRILEAKGWSQKRLAASLGVSPGLVSSRLRIARLPQGVRAQVAGGKLPLAVLPEIEKVAAVSPAIAEAVSDPDRVETLPRDALDVAAELRQLAWDRRSDPGPYILELGRGGSSLQGFGLDPDEHPELAKLWKEKLGQYEYLHLPGTTEELADQARAYGCLLEVGPYAFLTDEAWVADRVGEALKRRRRPRQGGAAASSPASDEDQKAAKAAQREEQRVEALAAVARNQELEQVLRVSLSGDEALTSDVARLIAAAALTEISPGRVALVFGELHAVTKTGTESKQRVKVTTKPAPEIASWMRGWVLGASNPGEILTRTATLMLAHYLGDPRAVAQSQRPYHHDEPLPVHNVLPAVPETVDPVLVAQFRERFKYTLEYPLDEVDDETEPDDPEGAGAEEADVDG